jgi:hypothetical protein
MPVTKKKLPSGKVKVTTPGGVKSKGTTPAKAAAQERLLNAIEHNPDFIPKKKKKARWDEKETCENKTTHAKEQTRPVARWSGG